MAHIVLTEECLQVERAIAAVEAPAYGAVVTFTGNVRAVSRGRSVHYLEYSAYMRLAEKELGKIVDEAEGRWRVHCAIEHRLGRVNVGEASVVVAVAAPHRGDAFESCRWLMDMLKESVPIWKKEHFNDGAAHWVEGSNVVEAT